MAKSGLVEVVGIEMARKLTYRSLPVCNGDTPRQTRNDVFDVAEVVLAPRVDEIWILDRSLRHGALHRQSKLAVVEVSDVPRQVAAARGVAPWAVFGSHCEEPVVTESTKAAVTRFRKPAVTVLRKRLRKPVVTESTKSC